eukprot:756383-Pyramimonas_sp.AAC.1
MWQRQHNLLQKGLADALAGLRHAAVMDNNGITVAALRLLYEARPDAVHQAFFDLARSQEEMVSLIILGRASAKRPGAIPPTK